MPVKQAQDMKSNKKIAAESFLQLASACKVDEAFDQFIHQHLFHHSDQIPHESH